MHNFYINPIIDWMHRKTNYFKRLILVMIYIKTEK